MTVTGTVAPMQLSTARLVMRPIEDRDRAAFIAMNLDPDVMRFFAAPYWPEKSLEHIARYRDQLLRDGFSFLTLEHRRSGAYLGIVGMQVMTTVVPNLAQPAVEIGWRLVKSAHGQGYATEAGEAIIDYAFAVRKLPEVVAIISAGNAASTRVAEKLGMTLRPECAFDHPLYSADDPHRHHLLYSIENRPGNETSCSTPL